MVGAKGVDARGAGIYWCAPWGAAAIALAVRSAIIEGATAEDGAVVLVGAPNVGKS
jgi:hypothetical protein